MAWKVIDERIQPLTARESLKEALETIERLRAPGQSGGLHKLSPSNIGRSPCEVQQQQAVAPGAQGLALSMRMWSARTMRRSSAYQHMHIDSSMDRSSTLELMGVIWIAKAVPASKRGFHGTYTELGGFFGHSTSPAAWVRDLLNQGRLLG